MTYNVLMGTLNRTNSTQLALNPYIPKPYRFRCCSYNTVVLPNAIKTQRHILSQEASCYDEMCAPNFRVKFPKLWSGFCRPPHWGPRRSLGPLSRIDSATTRDESGWERHSHLARHFCNLAFPSLKERSFFHGNGRSQAG